MQPLQAAGGKAGPSHVAHFLFMFWNGVLVVDLTAPYRARHCRHCVLNLAWHLNADMLLLLVNSRQCISQAWFRAEVDTA